MSNKEQQYEQTLIKAAARFRMLAKEVSALGDKHVSMYTANTIASHADMMEHIILKALGEKQVDHQVKREVIRKKKDDADI